MNVIVDKRVDRLVETLADVDQARIAGYLDLFRQYQFGLPVKYLRKIEKNLWELRPGSIRLLLGRVGTKIIIVNVFRKKGQKTPRREIKTTRKRLQEYQL